jgi:3-hydroxyacyl-CoA dehydrogenase/enoyl-CoA hydratase/3-hydroxybutyryl-CoA epimerase
VVLADLKEFRLERSSNDVLHLIFDAPGRAMNVFSNAAIEELGIFAQWLSASDLRGVVVRSGKPSAFCAGADLTELGVAYDMIMAAPAERRSQMAYDHFFRLSLALRKLETAGKPVAAAIAGLALGGGGELALAAHHRVMIDDPRAAFGLPESLVGLLPGGGGTQRLPRLAGVEAALPILLEGARLTGRAAVTAGVIDELVPAGQEVAAAERWVLANPGASQPWDRAGWRPADADRVAAMIDKKRADVLADTLGHYPAPLSILDCVGTGLPLPFDEAIRAEMQIFARLIQRREPRNMIRTMFLGRLDHDRLRKAGASVRRSNVRWRRSRPTSMSARVKTLFSQQRWPAPVFAGTLCRDPPSMVSSPIRRSGSRQNPPPMPSRRCGGISRASMKRRPNGAQNFRRKSAAPRTICW